MRYGPPNRVTGNQFETAFAAMLAKDGFWVTKLTQTASGQPADLIAVKNDKAILIDCKVCQDDYFILRRIEPNQKTAMAFWRDRGNHQYWFAALYNNKVYMLDGYVAIEQGTAGGLIITNHQWFWTYEEWKEMINGWPC